MKEKLKVGGTGGAMGLIAGVGIMAGVVAMQPVEEVNADQYQKVDDTHLKIITPTETIIDIANLKEFRRDAGVVRDQIASECDARLAKQDEIIAEYDKAISEASKLGIE